MNQTRLVIRLAGGMHLVYNLTMRVYFQTAVTDCDSELVKGHQLLRCCRNMLLPRSDEQCSS